MNSTPDDDIGPEWLLHYDGEGIVDGNDNEIPENGHPIFCASIEEVLTDDILSAL